MNETEILLAVMTVLALATAGMSIYYQVKYEDMKRKNENFTRIRQSYANDIKSLQGQLKKERKKKRR